MDPRDPSQRPSIFSNPEVIPDEVELTRQHQSPPPAGSPPIRGRVPTGPAAPPPPSRRLMVAAGAGGLLILLLGGFVAASILRPDDRSLAAESPTPTPSPVATATPTAAPSATVAPSVTPSPAPTPVPTPAGPPQDLAIGGWAKVAVEELNVRNAAGLDATQNYMLVRGAVVYVAEGPVDVSGLRWYRIASLGGARGWATSGWVAEPFMTTIVADPTLIRCGHVARPVFDIVNGVPTPHDPVSIGELALPAAGFSDLSLAAIELLRGVGSEACFSAQVGSDGVPAISTQLYVSACGHAVQDGDFFRLRPAAGQNVPVDAQVKDPAIVHPTVLVGGPPEDRKSSNLRTIVTMMASSDAATGCINLNVTEDSGGAEVQRYVDTSQCSIVHEHDADDIRLSPAAGGDTVWIKLTSQEYQPAPFPLEVPVRVAVNASASDHGSDAWAWQGYPADCG